MGNTGRRSKFRAQQAAEAVGGNLLGALCGKSLPQEACVVADYQGTGGEGGLFTEVVANRLRDCADVREREFVRNGRAPARSAESDCHLFRGLRGQRVRNHKIHGSTKYKSPISSVRFDFNPFPVNALGARGGRTVTLAFWGVKTFLCNEFAS